MPRANILLGTTTTIPTASQYLILFDSTRWGCNQHISGSQASLPAPGTARGQYMGTMIKGSIRVGNQAVTLVQQVLTGAAGTAADWETTQTGSIAVSASTTRPIEWRAEGSDFRLYVLAGGTAPDSLVVSLELITTSDFGA